jgi:predicted nucleic acid-binding protein
MSKRKSKSFYIDTNVAIDYATNRDIQTVLLLERIKERGWKCVSSTFLAMEMADYKQDYEFIAKEINKKRDPEDILRSRGTKNLRASDFQEIEEWFNEFQNHFRNLTLYDFMQDSNSWTLAKEISFNSNLSAPDVLHLTSAILGSIGGYCDVLITKDGMLRKEAEKIISQHKLSSKLKVFTPLEVKKNYFPQ